MTTESLDKPKSGPATKTGPSAGSALSELFRRAESGDKSSLPALRAVFSEGSGGDQLVDVYGSPAAWLEARLIDQSAGNNLAMKEGMERKLAKLRAELSGPSPTPLERLLVERAVICWLTVHLFEVRYSSANDLTLNQAEFQQRRIDKAHGRFLSALKTLAQIRKLALPALQVNIGANQVNVSGQ